MAIRTFRKETKNTLYMSVVSDLTHRFETFDESIYAHLSTSEEEGKTKLSKADAKKVLAERRAERIKEAEERIAEEVASFTRVDEEIASVYDVAMKKLELPIADIAHFSDADVKNLDDVIDFRKLIDYGKSLGVVLSPTGKAAALRLSAGAGDDEAEAGTEALIEDNEYKAKKRFLISVLEKDPALDLGVFRVKKVQGMEYGRPSTILERTGLTFRLKEGVKERIVAVDSSDRGNVLFVDGSYIGRPFTKNAKVHAFVAQVAAELETCTTVRRAKEVRASLAKFKDFLPEGMHKELKDKIDLNPIFADRYYSASARAYHDELRGANVEDRTGHIESLVWHELSQASEAHKASSDAAGKQPKKQSRWHDADEARSWFELPLDVSELAAKAKVQTDAYLNAFSAEGGHHGFLSDDKAMQGELEAVAAGVHSQLIRAGELLAEVRPWVETRLRAEKKPPTKKRIEKKLEEFVAEKGKNPYLQLSSRGPFERLFGDLIAKGDADKAAAEAAREERREQKFNPKAIKKPERAVEELGARWDDLPEEGREVLLATALSSKEGMDEFFSRLGHKVSIVETALRLHGKALLTYQKGLKKSAAKEGGWRDTEALKRIGPALLGAFVAMGATDLIDWDDLSTVNVVDLIDEVPSTHLVLAIKLLTARKGDKVADVSDKLDAALTRLHESCGGKLAADDLEVLYGVLERLAAEEGGLFHIIEKHAAWMVKLDKKFRRMLMVCAVKNPNSKIEIDPDAILDDKAIAFFLFRWAHKAKNIPVARKLLKAALPGAASSSSRDFFGRDDSVPEMLYIGKDWTMRSPQQLFSASDVAGNPDYADLLIESMRASKFQFPSSEDSYSGYGGGRKKEKSTEQAPSSLQKLAVIFDAGALSKAERTEFIKEVYGDDSAELFFYKKSTGDGSDKEIIEILMRRANDARGALRNAQSEEDRWDRARSERAAEAGLVSAFRIEPRFMHVFGRVAEKDRGFVTLENLAQLTAAQRKALPEKVLWVALGLAQEAFEEYSHTSSHESLASFLSLFSGSQDMSRRLVVSSKMGPMQAVIAAEHLQKDAVKECLELLLEVAQKNPKALKVIVELTGATLDSKNQQRLASTPEGIAARVRAGELALSEKEWEKFFAEKNRQLMSAAISELAVANLKLARGVLAMAETFDVNVQTVLYNLCSRSAMGGLEEFEVFARLYAEELGSAKREKSRTEDGEDNKSRLMTSIFEEKIQWICEEGSLPNLVRLMALCEEMGVNQKELASGIVGELVDSVAHNDGQAACAQHLIKAYGLSQKFTESLIEVSYYNKKERKKALAAVGLEDLAAEVEKLAKGTGDDETETSGSEGEI